MTWQNTKDHINTTYWYNYLDLSGLLSYSLIKIRVCLENYIKSQVTRERNYSRRIKYHGMFYHAHNICLGQLKSPTIGKRTRIKSF